MSDDQVVAIIAAILMAALPDLSADSAIRNGWVLLAQARAPKEGR